MNNILKPKSKEDIQKELIDKYNEIIYDNKFYTGQIVYVSLEIVNEDGESNKLSKEKFTKQFFTPFGIKLISWEDNEDNEWPFIFITIQGKIQNLLAWGEFQYDSEPNEFINLIETHLNEDVGAPMATLSNTPGMGNAVPATQSSFGSGDSWGYNKPSKKKKKIYVKKKKSNESFYPSIEEQNINPYDKLGVSMAKKLKVPIYFKKGKGQTVHQKQLKK